MTSLTPLVAGWNESLWWGFLKAPLSKCPRMLGGNERIIPKEGPTMLPPSYNGHSTNRIFILNREYMSESFYESENMQLPFPMANHCAVFLRKENTIFVHKEGRRIKTLLLNLNTLKWQEIESHEANQCTKDVVHEDQTHCEQLQAYMCTGRTFREGG